MKRLILIIMCAFCLNANCQEATEIKDIITRFISEYEKECYNDSTEVTFIYYRSTFGDFKAVYEHEPEIIVGELIKKEKGYIHKEPTLKGFVKWIDNKYNSEK